MFLIAEQQSRIKRVHSVWEFGLLLFGTTYSGRVKESYFKFSCVRRITGVMSAASPAPPVVSKTDVERRAEILRKALKGLGTKEADIIDVLTTSWTAKRQAIAAAYRAAYKTDLLEDIKSDTSGDFRKVLKALSQAPEVNDAKTLHHAVKGLGTDEDTILEILCTRTNEELNKTSNAYFSMFRATLISDIKKDTSGEFLEVLLALLSGIRDESERTDPIQAKSDAEALIKAGPKKWGTDVKTFTDIFATRNFAQLRETFQEFEKLHGTDIQTAVKNEMSGDLAKSFLVLVQLVQSKEEYFAERLHKAVKGLGTADDNLIRILVSRKEKDLLAIATAFEKVHKKSLAAVIADETSSNYKDALLAILQNAV
ncbi:Annexin B11 [Hypsibius exemplaris]|uniref:Annexin n=1 Tax=Hypsibius exemplaris TaxID=2072580 RepID=A0A1W0WUL5_HYPEX|nr:Annexin B11 [Hypsibius exemplaris]